MFKMRIRFFCFFIVHYENNALIRLQYAVDFLFIIRQFFTSASRLWYDLLIVNDFSCSFRKNV